ncbi:MAG: hypothetical protein J7493_01495 [Porphyrobacter sp.]|nr:hypothetical protein [Porphyrobacter sp.]
MRETSVKLGLAALGLLAVSVPAAAQFGGPPPAPNTGVPVYTRLAGGQAGGSFTGVIDPPKGQFCYIMNVTGTNAPTAASINGDNGASVLSLGALSGNSSGGCQPIAADLAAAILANPSAYYVSVPTSVGALQGRLSK